MIKDPEGLRKALRELLDGGGVLAEHAYVLGVLRAVAADEQRTPEQAVADLREVHLIHQNVIMDWPHGAFSTCDVSGRGCRHCADAAAAADTTWHASLSANGIELVHISSLSPEQQQAAREADEHAVLADEMRAAAGPDDEYDAGRYDDQGE